MTDYIKVCSHCARPYSHGLPNCPRCEGGDIANLSTNPFLSGQYSKYPVMVDLPAGTGLLDRFTIKEKLGNGRWNSVYLADDSLRAMRVALKVIMIGPTSQVEAVRHHQREMNHFIRLTDFKHVLQIYDLHSAPWGGACLLLLAMEYADGGTFRSWLNQHKEDRETRLTKGLELYLQVCQGLDSIHKAGLIHLDLKPENLLFVNSILKVSDLGTAYPLGLEMDENISFNDTSLLEMGTPTYMSPEHFSVAHPDELDARADIYSMGVILYELLSPSCRPPFGGSMERLRDCHLNVSPSPLNDLKNGLGEVVTCCLQKQSKDRFQTVEELVKAILGQGKASVSRERESDEGISSDIENKWDQANLLLHNGKLSLALSLLEEILLEHADHYRARQLKEDIRERYKTAEQLCLEAENKLENGKLEECIAIMSMTVQIYPEHPSASLIQAKAALKAERFADVMAEGRDALVEGRWGTALNCFGEALQIDRSTPNVAELLEWLNRIQENRRDIDLAVGKGDFEKAGRLAALVDALTAELENRIPSLREGRND